MSPKPRVFGGLSEEIRAAGGIKSWQGKSLVSDISGNIGGVS
jgi:hypothetical protein